MATIFVLLGTSSIHNAFLQEPKNGNSGTIPDIQRIQRRRGMYTSTTAHSNVLLKRIKTLYIGRTYVQ